MKHRRLDVVLYAALAALIVIGVAGLQAAEPVEPPPADEATEALRHVGTALQRGAVAVPEPYRSICLALGSALVLLAPALVMLWRRRDRSALVATAAAIQAYRHLHPDEWEALGNLLARFHDRAGVRELVRKVRRDNGISNAAAVVHWREAL